MVRRVKIPTEPLRKGETNIRELNVTGTVKYVELFGTVSSIPANSEVRIVRFEVPAGHCAELFAIGVIPDFNPSTNTSNLDGVFVAVNGRKFPHANFSANGVSRNAVPYGHASSKQPIFRIDRPLTPGNLTYKFNEKETVEIWGRAGDSAVSLPVYVRALLFLLEEEDVRTIYGKSVTNFATLPGGHQQENPVLLFAEYFDNVATSGKGRFESVAEIDLAPWEQLQLRKLGVYPHDNADSLKLVDYRTKKEFPEYEPYWKVNASYNVLPFGDANDFQPAPELPDVIKLYTWTNTKLMIQVRDTGTAIPAKGMRFQLIGVYRVVR